jgi:Protein of unknown function (DUF2635)
MSKNNEMIFIKPAEGLTIRDPKSRMQIPEDGKLVKRDTYWMRRIHDGDVILSTPKILKTVEAVEDVKNVDEWSIPGA